jgi:transposase
LANCPTAPYGHFTLVDVTGNEVRRALLAHALERLLTLGTEITTEYWRTGSAAEEWKERLKEFGFAPEKARGNRVGLVDREACRQAIEKYRSKPTATK